jgi:hypothetical protein
MVSRAMTSIPKRPFWQIHLSTAIIIMMVGGVLLGLNFTERLVDNELIRDAEVKGWPFPVITYAEWPSPAGKPVLLAGNPARVKHYLEIPKWHSNGIAMNALLGVLFLTATASVSEFAVRHREARKP